MKPGPYYCSSCSFEFLPGPALCPACSQAPDAELVWPVRRETREEEPFQVQDKN